MSIEYRRGTGILNADGVMTEYVDIADLNDLSEEFLNEPDIAMRQMKKTLVIKHRDFKQRYPETSLSDSFEYLKLIDPRNLPTRQYTENFRCRITHAARSLSAINQESAYKLPYKYIDLPPTYAELLDRGIFTPFVAERFMLKFPRYVPENHLDFPDPAGALLADALANASDDDDFPGDGGGGGAGGPGGGGAGGGGAGSDNEPGNDGNDEGAAGGGGGVASRATPGGPGAAPAAPSPGGPAAAPASPVAPAKPEDLEPGVLCRLIAEFPSIWNPPSRRSEMTGLPDDFYSDPFILPLLANPNTDATVAGITELKGNIIRTQSGHQLEVTEDAEKWAEHVLDNRAVHEARLQAMEEENESIYEPWVSKAWLGRSQQRARLLGEGQRAASGSLSQHASTVRGLLDRPTFPNIPPPTPGAGHLTGSGLQMHADVRRKGSEWARDRPPPLPPTLPRPRSSSYHGMVEAVHPRTGRHYKRDAPRPPRAPREASVRGWRHYDPKKAEEAQRAREAVEALEDPSVSGALLQELGYATGGQEPRQGTSSLGGPPGRGRSHTVADPLAVQPDDGRGRRRSLSPSDRSTSAHARLRTGQSPAGQTPRRSRSRTRNRSRSRSPGGSRSTSRRRPRHRSRSSSSRGRGGRRGGRS